MEQESPVQGYEPPLMVEVGTVTGATLGTNKKDGQDDTEYWH